MLRFARLMLCACAVGLITTSAGAAIVWDYSPDHTGAGLGGYWSNVSTSQNFAERVIFTDATDLTGMDIFTGDDVGVRVGSLALIRVWSDDSGKPGSLLHEFSEVISVIDTDGTSTIGSGIRVLVNFTNVLSLAGGTTFWIGMSGVGFELGQMGLATNFPDDSKMYQFFDTTGEFFTDTGVGDQAFRLYSTAVVPEPSTLISASVAGLFACATIRSRRRRTA